MKETALFATTLDLAIARIYSISSWEANEIKLAEDREQPEWSEAVLFRANRWGEETEMDSQGRILLPTDLRRKLGIENQPVWIDYANGALNVYSEDEFRRREAGADAVLDQALPYVKRLGVR